MSSNELVKIVCCRCGDYWYVSSVREFARQVEQMWLPWEKYLSPEQKELIKQKNDPARMEKIWKTEGQIKTFCEKCRLKMTLELMYGGKVRREVG